jgi:Resolvase, N terminal domain
MKKPAPREARATLPLVRCAVYTRQSTEESLEQQFNSLDAQRESAEAFVASQRAEGWACLPQRYDDGGFTGGNMERPSNGPWPTSRRARSTAWWSTRSIASAARSWTSPA